MLNSTIGELETMHSRYECVGTKCQQDVENINSIRFNLVKRNDLVSDHIALCHSMKERAEKIKVLTEEIHDLNTFSKTLFSGINFILTE